MNLKMTLETELKDLETSSLCLRLRNGFSIDLGWNEEIVSPTENGYTVSLNGLFVWRNEGDNIYLSDRPGLLDDAVVEEFEFCHTDPSGANSDLIASDSTTGIPLHIKEMVFHDDWSGEKIILTGRDCDPTVPEAPGFDALKSEMYSHPRLKAVNIEWNVDDTEELESLPKELEIPVGMEDEEEISDYLSATTGFCHSGFGLVEVAGNAPLTTQIQTAVAKAKHSPKESVVVGREGR